MGWKVIIAPSARADLRSIIRFLARQNSDAAVRVGYELIVRAERLAAFPEMGRVVPEFQQRNLRETVSRSYRIIHRRAAGTAAYRDSALLAWGARFFADSPRT